MTTPRPPRDAGHQEDVLLVLPLMIVGLLLAWATLKYGWFGITPIAPEPDKAPSTVSTPH